MLLTTEKDAMRLLQARHLGEALCQRLFYVPIATEFLTPEESQAFEKFVNEKIIRKFAAPKKAGNRNKFTVLT